MEPIKDFALGVCPRDLLPQHTHVLNRFPQIHVYLELQNVTLHGNSSFKKIIYGCAVLHCFVGFLNCSEQWLLLVATCKLFVAVVSLVGAGS